MKPETPKPINESLGMWNAWVADGKTQEIRKERLNQTPERLKEQVLKHAQLVRRLKND